MLNVVAKNGRQKRMKENDRNRAKIDPRKKLLSFWLYNNTGLLHFKVCDSNKTVLIYMNRFYM